jgi:hypothetical protein
MKKILLALILLLLTLVSKTFSQAPVVFNGNTVIIGKSVSILEDPSNTLRLSDVIASTKFIPSQTQTPNLQLSKFLCQKQIFIRRADACAGVPYPIRV